MFGQVILTKEAKRKNEALGLNLKSVKSNKSTNLPLLANTTLVRFDAGVPHFVSPHIGAIGKFHITNVAFENFARC